MIPVVLSGGSGTRLWPVSRKKWPKQFCTIFPQSLQDMTLMRVSKLGTPWILTNVDLKTQTETALFQKGLSVQNILYEPLAKNTGPALAFLCRVLAQKSLEDSIVAVFPSDHLVQNVEVFTSAMQAAEQEASLGNIVTLGIQPQYAETGYGYIEVEQGPKNSMSIKSVLNFHEKPNLEKAEKFVSAGNYYWNAGIFIFKASRMIELFEKYQSKMWKQFLSLDSNLQNLQKIYSGLESISIDYAIMEKLDSQVLKCIPVDMGWNDVGSWDAVSDIQEKGQLKNENLVQINAKNNFLSGDGRQVAVVGQDDLIIVDTKDALLITKRGKSQDVKKVVELLTAEKSPTVLESNEEKRPWGDFQVLMDTQDFKSKHIRIKPQSQISYQSHAKREEHWIITSGKGEVVLDENIYPVQKGSHINIPMGAKHRIRNTSAQENLEFIEVQLGSYFGEDDIIRYQDDYMRV